MGFRPDVRFGPLADMDLSSPRTDARFPFVQSDYWHASSRAHGIRLTPRVLSRRRRTAGTRTCAGPRARPRSPRYWTETSAGRSSGTFAGRRAASSRRICVTASRRDTPTPDRLLSVPGVVRVSNHYLVYLPAPRTRTNPEANMVALGQSRSHLNGRKRVRERLSWGLA
jgi:hypothetical protein